MSRSVYACCPAATCLDAACAAVSHGARALPAGRPRAAAAGQARGLRQLHEVVLFLRRCLLAVRPVSTEVAWLAHVQLCRQHALQATTLLLLLDLFITCSCALAADSSVVTQTAPWLLTQSGWVTRGLRQSSQGFRRLQLAQRSGTSCLASMTTRSWRWTSRPFAFCPGRRPCTVHCVMQPRAWAV